MRFLPKCALLLALLSSSLPLYGESKLVFPRLVIQQGRFSGVAIANPTSTSAAVTLTAYKPDGSLFTGTDVTNPVTVTVAAGSQLAKLVTEVFLAPGSPTAESPTPLGFWMEVTSPVDGLTGFFLDGNYAVDFLDGSDLSGSGGDLILPFVENTGGSVTEIAVVNPDGSGAANVTVELTGDDGTVIRTYTQTIPARGALQGALSSLFPGSFDAVRAVRMRGDKPFACVAYITRQPENSLVVVPARAANAPAEVLYFPQLAQGAEWSTSVGLANLTSSQILVTLTACQADGTLFAPPALQNNPVTVSIKPGGSLRESAKTLFGFAGTPLQVGWIKAEASDAAITGYVEYGAGTNRALVAAQAVPVSRAVFSHQANGNGYYTGLAVLNSSSLSANVDVASLSNTGQSLGNTKRVLRPGQREAILIPQWIAGANGVAGGLIFLKTDVPVIASQLFGTSSFTALSNVPPQDVPASFDPVGTGSLTVVPPLAVVETGKTLKFSTTGATAGSWKVNGRTPGDSTVGTVSGTGLYTAPATAPSQHTQTVEAATADGNQSSAASVDVVQREVLASSLTLLTAVAYFQNLQQFYVAEQQLLSSAPGGAYAAAANTRISKVNTSGVAETFYTLTNDTVSKMLPFTDGAGASHLLLAGLDTGKIYRLTLSSKSLSTVATGLNQPNSMALDPVSGNLYVSEGGSNQITIIEKSKFDTSSAAPSALWAAQPDVRPLAVPSPRGIAFDPCTGALFVSTADGVLREFLDNRERQVLTGLDNPGQLLVLLRQGLASCYDAVTVFAAERTRVAQIDPRAGLVVDFLSATQDVRDLGFFDKDSPFTRGEEAIIIAEGPIGIGLSRVLIVPVGRLYQGEPDDEPLSTGLEFYPAGGIDDGGGGGGGGTGATVRISYYDRTGDTFATAASRQARVVIADISAISIYQVAGQNVVSVTLTRPVAPAWAGASNSIVGWIDFDTQKGTGTASHADAYRLLRPGAPETDAFIDLSTGILYTVAAGPSGAVAAAAETRVGLYFFGNTVTGVFPVTLLDALKSRINVTVGNQVEITDIAPEARFAFINPPPITTRTVQFAGPSSGGPESTASVSTDVVLSSASTQTVTVRYSAAGGTAAAGADYTLPAGILTFAPGETSKRISLTVVNDALDEPDETIVIGLSDAVGAAVGNINSHTYTIIDDDSPPSVRFSAPSSAGLESVTAAPLGVTLSGASGKTVTVQYAVTGGTATGGGVDYSLTAGTLTFAPGQTARSVNLTVVNDTTDETDETIVVTLSSPSNATLGSPSAHTYTIIDDDNPALPRVQFQAAASSGSESATTVNLAVTLSAAPATTVTVSYAVTGGTATNYVNPNLPGDFNLQPGTLTFSPTDPLTKYISFTVVNDTTDEPNETVIVTLSNPVNALLGTNTTHTYTINDDDATLPTVQFGSASSSGSETVPGVSIPVTLSAAWTGSVSVSYQVTGGTATQGAPGAGGDYVLSPGTLIIPAGQTSGNISLSVTNDALDEDNETIIIGLTGATNATVGAPSTHTRTIVDDDPLPVVSFRTSNVTVSEGITPPTVTVWVDLSTASGRNVSVNYSATGGAATGGGVDYTLPPGTLTFSPGQLSASITITINNDSSVESTEDAVISLSSLVNCQAGQIMQFTLYIRDNDILF